MDKIDKQRQEFEKMRKDYVGSTTDSFYKDKLQELCEKYEEKYLCLLIDYFEVKELYEIHKKITTNIFRQHMPNLKKPCPVHGDKE